jgi:hypothetical protein
MFGPLPRSPRRPLGSLRSLNTLTARGRNERAPPTEPSHGPGSLRLGLGHTAVAEVAAPSRSGWSAVDARCGDFLDGGSEADECAHRERSRARVFRRRARREPHEQRLTRSRDESQLSFRGTGGAREL